MATKKSSPKKKRSPKKRKPKVKLDNRKVMALAAVMIFICAVVLSAAFLFSSQSDSKVAVEKQIQSVKPAEKKNSVTAVSKNEVKAEPKKIPEKIETKRQPKKEDPAPQKTVVKTEPKPAPKAEQKTNPKVETKVQVKTESKPVESKSKFSIPQSVNNARLCFIIDDGGQKTTNIRKYTTLPFPVAIAVLPQLAYTKECARIVVADKKELMLHQPMQAQNLKMNPGPGAILPDMSLREVYAMVSKNLSELGPQVKGFNNHEGSLITCDLNMMGAVLDAAADNKVYFVDSRTSKDTMATFAALERDMKILEREVFIDDIIDRAEMLKQIMRGIDIANKKGKVIMIGHVDKSAKILPALLSEMYPELKAKGYRLVFPSQLL
ncbi:divergent polysaccharide deacetylase family protein [Treponema sp.]|uniref:divergent polysaccharide deacetylase family protein n=1 Tax=Treponema sp. TaxID=166 RepID=UPI00298DE72E|nr:divergent polysaccharide deacetylase family protein [Treponema sp.]MCQ2241793.1 divergent polysaccharide deacetylase family protein [Treponema sp.]